MAKIAMDCKKIMVKEISSRLNNADMLIVTSYKGLSSQDLDELRRELRNNSSEYLVVKDSMAKKALAEGANKTITKLVEGEVGIAIDRKEDPTLLSRILIKFAKDHEFLKICGGIMDGSLISKEDIAALAALPSREVLLGRLANVLNAPIQGLAGALNGIITKIVYALNAVKDKKQEAEDGKQQVTPRLRSGQASDASTSLGAGKQQEEKNKPEQPEKFEENREQGSET